MIVTHKADVLITKIRYYLPYITHKADVLIKKYQIM